SASTTRARDPSARRAPTATALKRDGPAASQWTRWRSAPPHGGFVSDHLIAPHGGSLVDLLVDDERAEELRKQSTDWPSWNLTPRQLCDLELLLTGGFSPLRGFMGQADYEAVRDSCRLADGTLWPMPITLDVPEDVAAGLDPG